MADSGLSTPFESARRLHFPAAKLKRARRDSVNSGDCLHIAPITDITENRYRAALLSAFTLARNANTHLARCRIAGLLERVNCESCACDFALSRQLR